MNFAYLIPFAGLRRPLLLTGAVCCALFLAACSTTPDEPAPTAETETASEATPALPTGGDYHSTALRARGRTTDRLDDIQSIRQEQVTEEAEGNKP